MIQLNSEITVAQSLYIHQEIKLFLKCSNYMPKSSIKFPFYILNDSNNWISFLLCLLSFSFQTLAFVSSMASILKIKFQTPRTKNLDTELCYRPLDRILVYFWKVGKVGAHHLNRVWNWIDPNMSFNLNNTGLFPGRWGAGQTPPLSWTAIFNILAPESCLNSAHLLNHRCFVFALLPNKILLSLLAQHQ